jgi:uncharacterized repeat protein (TIGR01451 family)
VHTIKFWMKLNPGPDNDLVRIFIDNQDYGQCFTTWENFYRATSQEVPISDRLLFLSGNRDGDRLSLLGDGYLFDNVTTATADGPGPKDCSGGDEGPPDDIDVDKDTAKRSAQPGDLVTYRIRVRNRSGVRAHRVRVCDHPPRALRHVGGTPKLRRVKGRGLCHTFLRLRPGQRKTILATFRLRRGVTASSVSNDASVDVPTGSTPTPNPPESAGRPSRRRQTDRDSATLGVRAAFGPCPASVNPRAHTAC